MNLLMQNELQPRWAAISNPNNKDHFDMPDTEVLSPDITADDVKTAIQSAGIERIVVRDCSICGYLMSYLISGDEVGYDAGCNCGMGFNIRPSSFADLAESHNMQTMEKHRANYRKMFGMADESITPRRCSTNIVSDFYGECLACGAANGEACRDPS